MVVSRRALAAIAALSLTASACNPFGGDDEPPPATAPPPTTQPPSKVGASIDGVLTLGAVLPLTGELEAVGVAMQAAVELAVDEVNDQGGVLGADVVLTIEDSASTADGAAGAAGRLIDGGADAVVGPASTAELAGGVLGPATEAGRVVCTPTASGPEPSAADTARILFSATANRVGEAQVIAEGLADGGHDRVAVVRSAAGGGEAMATALVAELTDQFGAERFEVVADVDVDAGAAAEPDTEAEPGAATGVVDQVTRARPDAVVLFLAPDEAAPLLREMFDADLLPSAGNEGVAVWAADTLASEALPTAVDPRRPALLEGVQVVRPAPPSPTPAFDARLRAEQAIDDPTFGAETYECAVLIMLAALATGTDDPARLAGALPGLTTGGAACATFAACTGPALDDDDIRYTGVLGLEWADTGEPSRGSFEIVAFDRSGRLASPRTVGVEVEPVAPAPSAEAGSGATTTTPSSLAETTARS